MQQLLEHAAYMPHGYCLFWQPWLVILFAGSDLLIALSYSAIPVALLMFLRRRPDIRYRGLVALFAAFILLCGITHVFSILTLWVPVYPLHGIAKLVTGLVSAITAVTLIALVPRLVRIPSPAQLEAANADLRREIAAHETTTRQLREIQADLERKVARRTADLEAANDNLAIVSREAVHRAKNLLSVVSALARQTARTIGDSDDFVDIFNGRLEALSVANAAVLGSGHPSWAGLDEVARRQLAPLLDSFSGRIAIAGPPVPIGTLAAQQLCLALHELATNAIKYGALSVPDGTIDLHWTAGTGSEPHLTLVWQESSGADAAGIEGAPQGFGMRLLNDAVPSMLKGRARRQATETGLRYELTVPLEALMRTEPG